MKSIIYLGVESSDQAYENSKVQFYNSPSEITDPGFVSSPLYHYSSSFDLKRRRKYSIFFICPVDRIGFLKSTLKENYKGTNIYFTLGMASIVVVSINDYSKSKLKDQILNNYKNRLIKGYEIWDVNANKIIDYDHKKPKKSFKEDFEFLNFQNLQVLPSDLMFHIFEYQKYAKKLLSLDSLYDINRYKNTRRLLESTNTLIHDLLFILSDESKNELSPLSELINESNVKDITSAKNDEKSNTISSIVQLVSSLSYVSSQSYAGVFPILKNKGSVGFHSLLGLATSSQALNTIVEDLEKNLDLLPFEHMEEHTEIFSKNLFNSSILNGIFKLGSFNPEQWNKLSEFKDYKLQIKQTTSNKSSFYHRLSFFSGRLGYREHAFSASAAIQVIPSSLTTEWNLINYTHEIIHGHARTILDFLFDIKGVAQIGKDPMEWSQELYRFLDEKWNEKIESNGKVSAIDILKVALARYLYNADLNGSLHKPYNEDDYTNYTSNSSNYQPKTLYPTFKEVYWEINEILVHILDFKYIYLSNVDLYIKGIWCSWITIPSIYEKANQYLLRSLIVISISKKGDVYKRFHDSKIHLERILKVLVSEKSSLFAKILEILNDENNLEDLEYRFTNCFMLAGTFNSFLTTGDKLFIKPDDSHKLINTKNSKPKYDYAINRLDISFSQIKSGVLFLLSNLTAIFEEKSRLSQEEEQYESAWQLFLISNISYDS